ncbi:MAG: glycosyltransferase family 4 protein [Bacteroidota bacterium]
MQPAQKKKILFIVPYPVGEAGSQRFRFEQYFGVLRENGFEFEVSPFLSHKAWTVLYKKGFFLKKFSAILNGYLRRLVDLFRLGKFDFVFIHREASPFGPPWVEWFVAKVFRKFTIYDLDDAIWLANTSESNWMTKYFKRYRNANNTMKWATVISAGNRFLAEYASRFNRNILINPTTIDTDEHHNEIKKHGDHKFTIGWTGSHSTVQFLDEIVPVLQELEKKFDFEFHVIADRAPKFQLKSMKFVKWSKESEIVDLLRLNVGIMPLPDNIWTRGKCGFKALQYMALGIPAVVSNVGINTDIVDHEVNGCVCKTPGDWYLYLSKLMSDKEYLLRLSKNTREKIVSGYSVQSNKENFLHLFQSTTKDKITFASQS